MLVCDTGIPYSIARVYTCVNTQRKAIKALRFAFQSYLKFRRGTRAKNSNDCAHRFPLRSLSNSKQTLDLAINMSLLQVREPNVIIILLDTWMEACIFLTFSLILGHRRVLLPTHFIVTKSK